MTEKEEKELKAWMKSLESMKPRKLVFENDVRYRRALSENLVYLIPGEDDEIKAGRIEIEFTREGDNFLR